MSPLFGGVLLVGIMSNSSKFLCVSGLGILTAVLVAAANALVAYFTGFNVFSFSLWVFVPVGAILLGIAATSGYYLGCRFLQMRPGIFLFAQILVVAAATNVLIFYFEYLAVVWNERPDLVTSVDSFTAYLNLALTQQEMSIGGKVGVHAVGAVGEFGYALALIEFVGFLVGGYAAVRLMMTAPACSSCNLFYQRVARKKRHFESGHEVARYHDGLSSLPPDGPEFAARAAMGSSRGPYKVVTTLLQCPRCRRQVWQDKTWQNSTKLEQLNRFRMIPVGLDVAPLLRTKAAPAGET